MINIIKPIIFVSNKTLFVKRNQPLNSENEEGIGIVLTSIRDKLSST